MSELVTGMDETKRTDIGSTRMHENASRTANTTGTQCRSDQNGATTRKSIYSMHVLPTPIGTTRQLIYPTHDASPGSSLHAHYYGRPDILRRPPGYEMDHVTSRTFHAFSTWSQIMDQQQDPLLVKRKIMYYLLTWLCLLALDALLHWTGRLEWIMLCALSLLLMYRAFKVSFRLFLAITLLHLFLDMAVWILTWRTSPLSLTMVGQTTDQHQSRSYTWTQDSSSTTDWTWPWQWTSLRQCASLADLVVYFYGAPLMYGFDLSTWILWAVLVITDISYRGPRLARATTTWLFGIWSLLPIHVVGHGIYLLLSWSLRIFVGTQDRCLLRQSDTIPGKTNASKPSRWRLFSDRCTSNYGRTSLTGEDMMFDIFMCQPRLVMREHLAHRTDLNPHTGLTQQQFHQNYYYENASETISEPVDREREDNTQSKSRDTGSSRNRRRNRRSRADTLRQHRSKEKRQTPRLVKEETRHTSSYSASTSGYENDTTSDHESNADGKSSFQNMLCTEIPDSFDICVTDTTAESISFTWIFPPMLIEALNPRPIDELTAAIYGWTDSMDQDEYSSASIGARAATYDQGSEHEKEQRVFEGEGDDDEISEERGFKGEKDEAGETLVGEDGHRVKHWNKHRDKEGLKKVGSQDGHVHDDTSQHESEQQLWRSETYRTTETNLKSSLEGGRPHVNVPMMVAIHNLFVRVDNVIWPQAVLDFQHCVITVHGLHSATEYQISMSLSGYRSTPINVYTNPLSYDEILDEDSGLLASSHKSTTSSLLFESPSAGVVREPEDTLLEARKELEAELARVTEAKKECQVQLRKLRRDLRRQENQQSGEVEALRRSIARTNAQDAKNRQRIQELHDLIRRAQNRLGEIEREKARLREERDKANADVAQRNETLESLRNRHRDIEQQHQRQTAAAARQTRELQSKLQSVIQQRDDIQHRLERMRDQQLPTQSRDHADLMQRISAANARVEELRRLCETQKTAQEDDDDASMAQVRREIEAAQARNQSLRLLAHDERAFRDRLRDELYSLDNRSKRSTNTATESGPPSDAGARKLITNKVTDFNCRPASVPPPSTTSSL